MRAPLVRDERGFTLIELITVMAMLLIVVTALSGALIAALKTEEDMNRRFTSQINARIALDGLRREIHCATGVTPTGSWMVTIVLGSRCLIGAGTTATWCTSGSGTAYGLYRTVGASCSTSGRNLANYLTTGNVFTYTPQSAINLAYLSVSLPVDANPAAGRPDYVLQDDIVLRNSSRT
jgi:prepilin-type N-terminal cleavage/methylation domain-containing protein